MIGEIFLHAIWWDYSSEFMNINGRTCLYYAILWGILSIILINYLNPFVDKIYLFLIEKIKYKNIKKIIIALTIFLAFDSTITCFALENFLISVSNDYDIKIKGIENKNQNELLSKQYSNEKMLMIYPNIIILNNNNELIYLSSLLGDIKNYYYKFGND